MPARSKAALLAGLALAGCSIDRGPSNIRWSGGEPGGREAVDAHSHYVQAKAQLNAGNASLALDGFRKALRIDPRSIDALNGMGAAYDRIGRFDLSRNYYEQALGLDPNSRVTLNNFGYSLAMQGKRAEAREMLARASAGAPGDVSSQAARNLSHLAASAKAGTEAAKASGAGEARGGSWVERLSFSTQMLVTRIASAKAKPGIASVSYLADDVADEHRARYAAHYHKQRIHLDPAGLREMASDEITTGSETEAVLVVLNGVGRKGMAGRLAGFLTGNGAIRAEVGDTALPVQRSEIIYPAGQAEAAAAFAARLPFAVKLKPSTRATAITVTLGADATRFDDRLRAARTA